jgi:hypothetical protein
MAGATQVIMRPSFAVTSIEIIEYIDLEGKKKESVIKMLY